MKFLVDECTGPTVAQWLIENGYDTVSIYEGFCGYSDKEVLQKAFSENRILITNDKDFGEMIFRQKMFHRGVILLRLEDERSKNKIKILEKVLTQHLQELPDNFIVATVNGIRIIQIIDA